MTDQELKTYVGQQLAAGANPEVLRMALEAEGLSKEMIDGAFNPAPNPTPAAAPAPTPPPVPLPPPPPANLNIAPPTAAANLNAAATVPPTPAVPAVDPTAAPPPSSTPTMVTMDTGAKPAHSHKSLLIGSITFAVLLILALSGVYAFGYMNVTPEKAGQKMLLALNNVKSYKFTGALDGQFSTTGLSEKKYQGQLEFSGITDIRDSANPASDLHFKLTTEGMVFAADARILDKLYYLRLNEFPALGFTAANPILDQWIKIDSKTLMEQYGAGDENESTSLDAEQMQKIKDLYLRNSFVRLTEKLGQEKLDNANVYHFKYEIDHDKFKAFLVDAVKTVETEAYGQSAEDLAAEYGKVFDYVNFTNGEVWLGKSDFLPRKIVLTVRLTDNPDLGGVKGSLIVTYSLSDYNNTPKIEAPSSFKNFQEIIESIDTSELQAF